VKLGGHDTSVGQKLAVGFGVVIALVAALAGFAVVASLEVRALQARQRQVVAPRAEAAAALEAAVLETAVVARNYALRRRAQDLAAFERASAAADARLADLRRLPKEPEGQALADAIAPAFDEYRQRLQIFVRQAGEPGGADVRLAEQSVAAQREVMLASVRAFSAAQAAQMVTSSLAMTAATTRLVTSVAVIALLIVAVAAVAAMVVARSVRGPARRLVGAANAMAAGDYAPALLLEDPAPFDLRPEGDARFRDELREAARVFGRMAGILRDREGRLAAQGRLSTVLAMNLSPVEIATDALREMTAYAGAEVGAIYVADGEGGNLRPLAAFAAGRPLEVVRPGEGVPGQALADRRTIVVRDIPEDTPYAIDVGLEALRPRCVAAIPLYVGKRGLGALVVAGLHDLRPEAVEFLEEAASALAVSLDNALAHVRIEVLAVTLQEQNERLQAQNEELQAQSEELQAQAEELTSQGEQLQAQTEELQAQTEELQAQSDELRRHRDALEQRNDELGQAEVRKDRFLAMLGHELRNPLLAICAAADVLNAPAAAETSPAREVIARQSRQLARLLDDLLDTTRVSSGKLALARRPLELGEAVALAMRTLADPVTRGGHDVRVDTRPVWIDADPARVEQIVTNLLGNALKYTPAGGRIAVAVDRDGDDAVLCVADTGAGIRPEFLPHVFEAFSQEGPNGARGLGLGLTLVKQLVELHGGTVEAASPGRGRGTVVTVRIPACEPPAVPPSGPTGARATSVRRTVVLVDDNDDGRSMLRTALELQGHGVHEACDGPEGVAVALAVRPDIAFVDIDLPGFDGYEVARRLRREAGPVRLVALSGYGRPEDRQRAAAAGFDEHLVKPVDLERVAAILRGL
jgi:signal transduction histidine kinase/CHASE3 domain sensor protein